MRGKHNFKNLESRLARELGRIIGQDEQAELVRNTIRNRYQWFNLQARVDEMQASPNRFCMVPLGTDVLVDPQVEAYGTLLDILCTNIEQARRYACRVAEHTGQSWKLYRGKEWIDVILYSPELHRAVAVEASLAAVARELYGCVLKVGSTSDLNKGKFHVNH